MKGNRKRGRSWRDRGVKEGFGFVWGLKQNRSGRMAQGIALSSSPSTAKKKSSRACLCVGGSNPMERKMRKGGTDPV
jgi:hypothetical protein